MIEMFFKFFVSLGSEWVLYLLVGLSVIVLSLSIERYFFFSRVQKRTRLFWEHYTKKWLETGVPTELPSTLDNSYEAQLLKVFELNRKTNTAEKFGYMSDALLQSQKSQMDKNLALLGTLGNNAPYVGLVGTVIGIIGAFSNLAAQSSASSGALNASLAEALVSTAVGICVALESVIFYNLYVRKSKHVVDRLQTLKDLLMGVLSHG
jgi:biopolymer transport protein ExbB/TolQ